MFSPSSLWSHLFFLHVKIEETGNVEALRRTAREIMALQPKIKSPATEAMADSARRKVIELEK